MRLQPLHQSKLINIGCYHLTYFLVLASIIIIILLDEGLLTVRFSNPSIVALALGIHSLLIFFGKSLTKPRIHLILLDIQLDYASTQDLVHYLP